MTLLFGDEHFSKVMVRHPGVDSAIAGRIPPRRRWASDVPFVSFAHIPRYSSDGGGDPHRPFGYRLDDIMGQTFTFLRHTRLVIAHGGQAKSLTLFLTAAFCPLSLVSVVDNRTFTTGTFTWYSIVMVTRERHIPPQYVIHRECCGDATTAPHRGPQGRSSDM